MEALVAELEARKAGLPESAKSLLDKELDRVKWSIKKVKNLEIICR